MFFFFFYCKIGPQRLMTGEWSYFLGNVLMGVKVAFLLDYPLVLSLLKHRGVRAFLN